MLTVQLNILFDFTFIHCYFIPVTRKMSTHHFRIGHKFPKYQCGRHPLSSLFQPRKCVLANRVPEILENTSSDPNCQTFNFTLFSLVGGVSLGALVECSCSSEAKSSTYSIIGVLTNNSIYKVRMLGKGELLIRARCWILVRSISMK